MSSEIRIRPIENRDYPEVEKLTREAFWNLHAPGCNEHFLAHVMVNHPDFVPELSCVAEIDGKIVGNIMYTRSKVIASDKTAINTLTFGPLSVLPEMQRKGIGSKLVKNTVSLIDREQFPAIIIYGNPSNYVGQGFISSKKLSVGVAENIFPAAMLILPLDEKPFADRSWIFADSEVYNLNEEEAETFDRQFPPKEKEHRPSQELFSILSNSLIKTSD